MEKSQKSYPYQAERPHHRGKDIDPERIGEILAQGEWGVLSTVAADGEPYGTPLGYAWDEDRGELLIHTPPKGTKFNNIQQDNRVCFTIVGSHKLVTDKFRAEFESLVIFGRIFEIQDADEALRAATIFCRRFAPHIVAEMNVDEADREINDMAVMLDKARAHMALFRIVPEHVSSKQRKRQ